MRKLETKYRKGQTVLTSRGVGVVFEVIKRYNSPEFVYAIRLDNGPCCVFIFSESKEHSSFSGEYWYIIKRFDRFDIHEN